MNGNFYYSVICFIDGNEELTLEELLKMLPMPRMKKVCKDMKIEDNKKRLDLIQHMIKHASQRTAASMFKGAPSTEHIMIKRLVPIMCLYITWCQLCTPGLSSV